MNQLGWHWWPSDTAVATTEYDGRAPCINLGHCTPAARRGRRRAPTSPTGRMRIRAGVELRTRCRVREITINEHGMASGAIYYDAEGQGAIPAGRGRHHRLQRHGHAAAVAQFGIGAFPQRAGQFQRAGRQEPDVASLRRRSSAMSRSRRRQSRPPHDCLWSKEFYETDPERDFVRGYTFQFAPRHRPGQRGDHQRADGRLPWGEDHHRVYRATAASPPGDRRRTARTCPRSTTG